MSRYTVMFETRMIPATSWTVSNRSVVCKEGHPRSWRGWAPTENCSNTGNIVNNQSHEQHKRSLPLTRQQYEQARGSARRAEPALGGRVPAEERRPEEHGDDRSGGQEGPERDVVLAPPT